MKKLILNMVGVVLISCQLEQEADVKKYTITKFDKIICDTIKPLKEKGYAAKMIRVKGYADDSIFVSFGNKYYGHYLSKKIDKVFNMDYYGEGQAGFIFNPYKAKRGKLEIEFSLVGTSKY